MATLLGPLLGILEILMDHQALEEATLLAKRMWDASPSRASHPQWEVLGEVTKGVWIGYALAEMTKNGSLVESRT
jgi:hypothetical protein